MNQRGLHSGSVALIKAAQESNGKSGFAAPDLPSRTIFLLNSIHFLDTRFRLTFARFANN